MQKYCKENDPTYILGQTILSSLLELSNSFNDEQTTFVKQEKLEKIILGLEMVNNISRKTLQECKNLL